MKRWYWIGGIVIIAIATLVFVELRQKQKRCNGVVIKLDPKAEQPFFEEQDIVNLVTVNGVDKVEGMYLEEINLAGLEKRVLKNRLIKNCQIYEDLSGNLVVAIEQQNPIGRILKANSDDASAGGYFTDTGEIVQLSPQFTVRTVLLTGDFFSNPKNLKTQEGKNLIQFLSDLQNNQFWKAQIASILVSNDGELTLIPQVGSHQIEFGFADETTLSKLEKLKIFYKQILPHQGWDKYKTVCVKFRNQIVCK